MSDQQGYWSPAPKVAKTLTTGRSESFNTIVFSIRDLAADLDEEAAAAEGGVAAPDEIEATLGSYREPVFASISVVGNTTATTISLANTWYQVLVFDTDGPSNNAVPDYTNGHVTINKSGRYRIIMSSAVVSGAGAGARYECEARKNNGADRLISCGWKRDLSGGGGDMGSVGGHDIFDLSAGDTIEVWVRNITNTTDITFEEITLSVRIAEET